MSSPDFIALAKYTQWADNRLLDTAEKIPAEQLMADAGLSFGSAFQTLRHTLDVEWCYRLACEGQEAADELWKIEPIEDLAAVRAYWRGETDRLIALTEHLSDSDLDREVVPVWLKRPFKIRHLLIHLINHSTNHRTELGWHFTRLGASPGDIDFLDYLQTL